MKIYVLGGFAPDFAEGCVCTLSEVFTSENMARERFNEIKKDIEDLLEDNYENGRLEYYSLDCHDVRHNKYSLGSLNAKATLSPGKKEHIEMWRDWSTFNIGVSSGFSINHQNIELTLDRSLDFTVAAIGISVKEI